MTFSSKTVFLNAQCSFHKYVQLGNTNGTWTPVAASEYCCNEYISYVGYVFIDCCHWWQRAQRHRNSQERVEVERMGRSESVLTLSRTADTRWQNVDARAAAPPASIGSGLIPQDRPSHYSTNVTTTSITTYTHDCRGPCPNWLFHLYWSL